MATDSDALRRVAAMPATKLALMAREMRPRTGLLASEPIAIIGMSCRLPDGANSPEEFWQLLRDGRDGISEVPPDRWDIDAYYDPDPDAPGKMYTRCGGFLKFPVDRFDPEFFGISPREARSMDPQQRLLLEVAWEALENGGIRPSHLAGSNTGVFIGISTTDYANRVLKTDFLDLDAYGGTGTSHSVATGRISYVLGLQGPNVAVDTACSSSLVAVHLACQSLRSLECDSALAGGVNLLLGPENTVAFCRTRMMSPTGRCRSFDASADGYVRGEGCGIVMLKRLSDALAESDRILAVIRGSAVNQDGRSAGLTVPNGPAQQATLRKALTFVDPAQVDYIEAHGTGTQMGDPIEMHSLRAVFGTRRDKPLLVGSVKSNIGHLEAAAGIAGLIKLVLALEHEAIPPHLHLQRLNSHISLEGARISIPTKLMRWEHGTHPRTAGVSSFGFSGTNAHVVVEEAPALKAKAAEWERPRHVLALSAKTHEALRELVGRYDGVLADPAHADIADICYTANAGRSHFSHRIAAWGASAEQIRERLAERLNGDAQTETAAGIVFLFSGQGAQYAGMGRGLYETQPVFRRALEGCAEVFDADADVSLLEVIYGSRAELLSQTAFTQPALFALEWSLAEMWRSWGIRPSAVMGHSVGEFAAACVAGVMDWRDAMKLVTGRGRLMQALPAGGEMWAVAGTEEAVAAEVKGSGGEVGIAAVNAASSVVIAGAAVSVRGVVERLDRLGVRSQRLEVSHAFHSVQMDAATGELERMASAVKYRRPEMLWVANATGAEMGEVTGRYWREQARGTVQFAAGMARLKKSGYGAYLELGPGTTLIGLGKQDGGGEEAGWFSSLRRGKDDWSQTLESVAGLYERGVEIDWKSFDEPYARRKVSLPTYPFQRERYWTEIVERTGIAGPVATEEILHPLLGGRVDSALPETQFQSVIGTPRLPYLSDHRVYGQVVFPAAGYVEMALRAAEELHGAGAHELRDISLLEPLRLHANSGRTVQLIARQRDPAIEFEIHGHEGSTWRRHVIGLINPGLRAESPRVSIADLRSRCTEDVPAAAFYEALHEYGLEYGREFQGVERLWRGHNEALARVRLPESRLADACEYRLHPILLDAALQLLGACGEPEASGRHAWMPVSIERIWWSGLARTALWAHAAMRSESHGEAKIGDLKLFDESGIVVADVRGMRARRATREMLLRSASSRLGSVDDWLFEMEWVRQELDVARSANVVAASPRQIGERVDAEGTWVFFADDEGIGEQLQKRLGGVLVRAGTSYERLGAEEFQVRSTEPEDYQRLLREIAETGGCEGVVHLWSVTGKEREPGPGEMLDAQERGSRSVLYLAQALVRLKVTPPLWLVTNGAVAHAPVWGMGKVIALEHPELRCIRVEIEGAADVDVLHQEIGNSNGDDEVAYRNGARYAARLARCVPRAEPGPVTLRAGNRGALDDLALAAAERRAPEPGEVEIRVAAAGLNFRDVLATLAMYPGPTPALGGEFAGEIVRVGDDVVDLQPGDEVFGMGTGAFGTFVTAPARTVVRRSAALSAADAATLPIAYLTAAAGLEFLAKMRRGQRVLIHAGAGGVGMMAIQLARHAGAEVWATAGSPEKRAYLAGLGIEHVLNSRTLDFAEEIRRATAGAGVDIVLNSLSGEFIRESVSVLAQGGSFLEMGKRGIWTAEQMSAARPDVRYHVYDLGDICARQPDVIRRLFEEMLRRVEEGSIKPLPRRDFRLAEAIDAFRFMAQAKHIGKIVLTIDRDADQQPVAVRADGAYLITGGLGGLGLLAAQWLVERGAKELALTGRSEPSEYSSERIREWEQAGVRVRVARADVGRYEDMQRVVGDLTAPLRGVIHSAGILHDGVLLEQTWERFEEVMAPKVEGAWNLHVLTRDSPLDFFVLFSSAASVLGSPGQANYAAANAFLDGLARHRRDAGLPALSINWGAWSDVGSAATRQVETRLALHGLEMIPPRQGIEALAKALGSGRAEVVVIPIDWSKFQTQFAGGRAPTFLSSLMSKAPAAGDRESGNRADADLMLRLKTTPARGRHRVLMEALERPAAKVLGLSVGKAVNPARPLYEMGLDSLMAVELRNLLGRLVGRTLPATLLFDYPTLEAIAGYLEREILAFAEVRTEEQEKPAGAVPSSAREPIAVIGLGCRFPGAESPEAFWKLLHEGMDAIREIPAERWDVNAWYDADPDAPGRMNTRRAGFLGPVDQFDAGFFGIAPREAVQMDPQHRLLLEVSWEALEHAGQAPQSLAGTQTGVFVGICSNDYAKIPRLAESVDAYVPTGNASSMAAGRLSYLLGLQGPSVAMDTACSSSLVSLHLACQSLHSGECRMALAGGVNLIIAPETMVSFSKARMLSPEGLCKTFDAAANGFVRGEGCGMVVLKRLSDAEADGDRILAVIRGSAVNQDGRSNGLTAPNGPAQEAVIRRALADAGIAADDLSYVEAHGTGTPLGDPIEVQALGRVLGREREPLPIGSVKTNIGHLEGAAGVAGLIKVVLSLEHEEIPAHLHLSEKNPHIAWAETAVRIPVKAESWPRNGRRRIAGVSSFGFSGTNAHVVIEEAPLREIANAEEHRPLQILTITAKTPGALRELAGAYEKYLAREEVSVADFVYTANACRSPWEHRLAIVAATRAEARQKLADYLAGDTNGVVTGRTTATPQKIAFLFTGEESDYAETVRALYEIEPAFRQALDRCGANDLQNSFALQYALAELWRSWGIEPAAVMGRGPGEYVAECVAGVFSVEDGLRLLAERGFSPQIERRKPQIEIISDGAGQRLEAQLRDRGFGLCVEIGPALTDFRQLMQTLARLYVEGAEVDWHGFYKGRAHGPLAIPTYPFQRSRHWIEERPVLEKREKIHSARRSHPLLGRRLRSVLADVQFESLIGIEELPWLADHQVYGHPVVPAAAFLEMAMSSARSILGRGDIEVCDLVIQEPLLLDHGSATVQSVAKQLPGGAWNFGIYSATPETAEDASAAWRSHVQATLTHASDAMDSVEAPAISFEQLRARCDHEIGRDALYQAAHEQGLEPGPAFRGISRVWQGLGEAFGEIQLPVGTPFESEYAIHPALLDSVLQLVLAAATAAAGSTELFLPIGVERFTLSVHSPLRLFAHVQLRDGSGRDVMKADIRLFDETGRDVGAVVGLAVRRASRAALERAFQRAEADWLYGIEWRPKAIEPEPIRALVEAGRTWLILSADTRIGEKLARLLRAAGDTCRTAVAETLRNDDDFGQGFSGVIYIAGSSSLIATDLTTAQLRDVQRSVCRDVLDLGQALLQRSEAPPPRLWLVTENAQSVMASDRSCVAHSTLWGLAKSMALEHPELGCTCIDVDDMEADTSVEMLFHEIRHRRGENQVALRAGMRYVPRLFKKGAPPINPEFRADGTWLVTGGLGALGLLIAGELVKQGVRHLVLVSRGTPSAEVAKRIAEWEQAGVRLVLSQTDVADEEQLRAVFAAIASTMPPLRGVVHAAGVLADGVFLQQSWDRFERVMAPKVLGAWNLHRLTRELPLDYFILFSSMASVFGSAGQSNYNAANAFLDGLAHHRQAQRLPAVSVNWGPWAGTGMAASSFVRSFRGVGSIPSDEGCRLFRRLVGIETPQIAVLPIAWPEFLEQFASAFPPLLEDFAAQRQTRAVAPPPEAELLLRLEGAPVEERREVLEFWLRGLAARVLGLPDAGAADPAKPLHELGMNSLMAVEMRNILGTAVGRTLPATLLFDFPTVEAISGFLRADVLRIEFADAQPRTAAPQTARADSRADRVADIGQLSDDQVEELLVSKLRAWTKGKAE